MHKFTLAAFVVALSAFALSNPAAAQPGWGWGDCEHKSTLSVENEQNTGQSLAENPAPETPKADNEN